MCLVIQDRLVIVMTLSVINLAQTKNKVNL